LLACKELGGTKIGPTPIAFFIQTKATPPAHSFLAFFTISLAKEWPSVKLPHIPLYYGVKSPNLWLSVFVEYAKAWHRDHKTSKIKCGH
jgi:hypothetical protein